MKSLFLFLMVLFCIVSTSEAISWSDLGGYWKFDEGSGSTVSDASGNNNTGTLYGNTSWVNGKTGKGLYFDGSGDYVQIGDSVSLSPTSQLSIVSWVYTTGNFNYWTIVGKNEAYQNQLWDTNGIENSIYYGGWTQKQTGAVLTPGAWNQVVITFDGSTQRTYANGNLIQAWSLTAGITDSANPVYIGSWLGASEFFLGIIDEVSVWKKALTTAEVSSLYQNYGGNVTAYFAVPEFSSLMGLLVGLGALFFAKRQKSCR